MKTKKISSLIIAAFGVLSLTYAAQISFQPNFADPKFPPSDAFHAGCMNSIDVALDMQNQDISSVRLVISYDSKAIEMTSVKPDESVGGTIDSNIENDQVIVNAMDIKFDGDQGNLIQMLFKSAENVTSSSFGITSGSYAITKKGTKISLNNSATFKFSKVPECEPDMIAPTITLVKPKTTSGTIGLDTYFVFLLKDEGKGIDKNSIKITFNGEKYDATSRNIIRDKDYVGFYPKNWLPINKTVTLQISVTDLQAYGGANISKKKFTFQSATGIQFENNITPEMFRKTASNAYKIFGTPSECTTLFSILGSNATIATIAQKLGCEIFPLDENQPGSSQSNQPKISMISAFAIIGWLLFLIVLMLKLHYYVSYKQHKKLVKRLQEKD